jgi:dTDP-4-amino-4,6-dideoxygalactose transaminase|tara:strand:- start:1451 stop:2620 length:1170 start_codon:yes stop_codon:yes gene_type:complete
MKNEIPLFKVFMSDTAGDVAKEVLYSGYIGQGPKSVEFEDELKGFLSNDLVLLVNTATSAEHLAIHLLKKPFETYYNNEHHKWPGIQDGDEVLSPPLSCTATNFPTLANNLKIKWVDIDPTTLNMDLDDLARKVTPKTKVIMVVHWAGYPVDLDKLRKIQEHAKKMYGFKPAVIEDCAHAFGATYKRKKLGNHGNICTYSFGAIKHLTSIEGGLLVLPHLELYRRAKLLRWYGIDRESNRQDFRCETDIPEWGFKFNISDVNSAVGIENLKHMKQILATYRDNAKYYDKELKGVDGVTLLNYKKDRQASYWIYSMLVERKDDFMRCMKDWGIVTSQVHERNDIHSCVSEFRSQLPVLDKVIPKTVSIPVGWWVTEEDREYIVNCIKKGW